MAGFHLDHDVSRYLVAPLRAFGRNVATARELGLEAATDGRQLLAAADAGRTLVSHNRKDFELLHDAWLRWTEAWNVQQQHEGVLILPQSRDIQGLADALEGFASACLTARGRLYRWLRGQWVSFLS